MTTATKSGSWAELRACPHRQRAGGQKPAALEVSLFILQHGEIRIQTFIDISGKQLFHGRRVVLHVVGIEGVVVGQSICELNVDRWEPGLHQFQVNQQTPSASIAVDEGMDTLKLDVEPG